METVDNSSRFIDHTLKDWVANLDCAQREQCIDTIYAIMQETNVSTLRELNAKKLSSAKIVIKSMKNLDEPSRKAISHALMLLAKSAKVALVQVYRKKDTSRNQIASTENQGN